MEPGTYVGLASVAFVVVAGLIHLHVKVAVTQTDVRWIKSALRDHGLLPRVERERRNAEETENA